VLAASKIREIVLMMEAVNISESSVYFYENTGRSIPEGCRLYRKYMFFPQERGQAVALHFELINKKAQMICK
jgi:hypothetical protein